MTKIKICGLSRQCDVDFVNEAKVDYAGFVVNFPKSRRSVSPNLARELSSRLAKEIIPVGVFVDEEPELVAGLINSSTIAAAQLHGAEDETYIKKLRALCSCTVIQAFCIRNLDDVHRAAESSADYVLLDAGQGEGKTFDWKLAENLQRPCFVAGGINKHNVTDIIRQLAPFAVDMSSGVETDGYKDKDKIMAAAAAVRRFS